MGKSRTKNLDKLNKRVCEELPKLALKYGLKETVGLEEMLEYLTNRAGLLDVKFVQGRGHRKEQLQKDIEKLSEYKIRIKNYTDSLKICGKRKSYSKTDLDATFMRMKEDHMMNGQLKPGYNVQIGVESEYIVRLGLFPNPTDTTTLIPFLERVEKGCGHKFQNVTTDSGYASEENYTYLEQHSQNAYIKPADYEVRKTRKFKNDPYRVENLPYDEKMIVLFVLTASV